jgi:hypothetical protein
MMVLLICRSSPTCRVWRVGSRLGGIAPRYLPRPELGLPPAFYPAVFVDDRAERPDHCV